MFRLSKTDYSKIKPLIKSDNEISVFCVIDGIMPGEIFVNDLNEPLAALIKAPECNLIAGGLNDEFISNVSSELDFWDTVTPDSEPWFDKIPLIHKNKYIHPFKRRHYLLSQDHFIERNTDLPEGFVIEKVDLHVLRNSSYKNADKILEWVEDWKSDDDFYEKGAGNYIRNENTIVSWCLSDCSYGEKITIGIKTDENFRRQGFGIKVASETIKECFKKNYRLINWLCVDTNQGSIGIADKLGFVFTNSYYFFCSFLPTENLLDISEKEWADWGDYLGEASIHEPRLINESLYAYTRANNVVKTMDTINRMLHLGNELDIRKYKKSMDYFKSKGYCSNFNSPDWLEFMNSLTAL